MGAVPRVQLTARNRCRYQVSTLLVRSALVKPIFRVADSPEAGRILPKRPYLDRVRDAGDMSKWLADNRAGLRSAFS
jgi:hypothetical protein